MSPCSNYLLTGGYNRHGHVIDINGGNNVTTQANFDMKPGKVVGKSRKYAKTKIPALEGAGTIDFKKKILQGTWSPVEHMFALAFRNCIFLFKDK